MLFAASILAVASLRLPSLHVLWMFPASWLLGTLSLAFPISLLSVPGRLYGMLCCVGLDQEEVERNSRKVARFQELLTEGMDPERTAEQVKAEEESRGDKV